MIHNIKINYKYVEPILSGEKRFEVRNDDRLYQKGDLVRFTIVDDCGLKKEDHAMLWSKTYEITYVVHGFGLRKGYCAFGFKDITEMFVRDLCSRVDTKKEPFNMLDLVEKACAKIRHYGARRVRIGEPVWQIWYNDDKGCWEVDELKVTGAGYDGVRMSDKKDDPQDTSLLVSWSEIGDEFFLTREEAEREAEKRNRIEQEDADVGESKEV
ncbi:MAG: DUF3850 domain-containing protein [Oscillospiraceae bacterium]|nr:DUF3850 domain-containing protein [Oscillospiraceae bacterium]